MPQPIVNVALSFQKFWLLEEDLDVVLMMDANLVFVEDRNAVGIAHKTSTKLQRLRRHGQFNLELSN